MSPAEESVTRTNLVWGTQQGCVCVLCFGLSRPAVRMTGNCECVPEERLEDSLSLCVCVSLFSPPSKVSPSSSSSHPIPSCFVSSHISILFLFFRFPTTLFPPIIPHLAWLRLLSFPLPLCLPIYILRTASSSTRRYNPTPSCLTA